MSNNALKNNNSILNKNITMIDWTEKYRPKTFEDLILKPYIRKKGRKSNPIDPKDNIKKWTKAWNEGKHKKKAIILSGKPGIGKTSCAYVIANSYNWTPIELNTSDARNKTQIRKVATAGSRHQTFSSEGEYNSIKNNGRKLIILDEADNLYERDGSKTSDGKNLSDRGGKKEIIYTIQHTNHPIILIVNDYYNLIKGSGKILEQLCYHIIFPQPSSTDILVLLKRISKQENIKVEPIVLKEISAHSNGDIRSAIRDLQSICIGRKNVSSKDVTSIGNRDQVKEIFTVLSTIFQGYNIDEIKKQVWNLDVDPQMLLYWVTENIPRAYKHPVDMSNAFHYATNADIFLSRTFRRNNYRMWAYASNHMSIGVSLSKTNPIGYQRYSYPTWLRTRKKTDEKKQAEHMITEFSSKYHCSKDKIKSHILPYFLKIESINEDISDELEFSKNNQKKEKTSKINDKDIPSTKHEQQKTLFS